MKALGQFIDDQSPGRSYDIPHEIGVSLSRFRDGQQDE